MNDILIESVFFGVGLTLLCFEIGQIAKKKLKIPLFNPILIATVLIIGALLLLDMDYDTYYEGAKYISYLLTPATVCLAIPMYEQMSLLKKNWKAVMAGIIAGCLTSLVSILAMAVLFGLSHETYVTLLPKSITTAIGMGVSETLGGYVTITVAVIIITGILGNMFGEAVCRLFRIEEPIAKGVGFGTASHAVGTAKAIEIGEIEGAMSSLSIAVAGLVTVVGASVFACFW
ncbi:LrgB family protein [Anaerovoracaceae bacterium 41-7]|jgi:predicted murein hydrolase (TIGR00659 family)|uniref:LrgB family protein n=1 Tax=Anaerovoracaceae TaxID=543314 RepID=UPI0013798DF0|nr:MULTISPECIES: LrgB family protein [Clostridia]MCI9475046.1 LrgB family protein [Emergencia sp.]MCI9639829.1 LrgB family protein [Emergencia sp.]NCE97786.1 LrgB family protein [Emergencia sp. 1XD21-10]